MEVKRATTIAALGSLVLMLGAFIGSNAEEGTSLLNYYCDDDQMPDSDTQTAAFKALDNVVQRSSGHMRESSVVINGRAGWAKAECDADVDSDGCQNCLSAACDDLLNRCYTDGCYSASAHIKLRDCSLQWAA